MSQVQTNLSGLEQRFQIVKELGSGATGSVFAADDLVLKRRVAIKVLHAGFNSSAAARFQREAQATSKLNHPNLVHVLDFGIDSADKPYLVMEYLNGVDLKSFLAEQKQLPVEIVLDIGIQLSSALYHAHEKGVLHRDIKPSNIIMHETEHEQSLKLVDFGLAKLLHSSQSLTTPGVTVGTALYLSPEIIKGEAPDERADLYSVGCVLYECLTGRPPFIGETSHQTLLLHTTAPMPDLGDDCPEFLVEILTRLLDKDPKKRIQSAKELQHELEVHLQKLTFVPGTDESNDAVHETARGERSSMPLDIKPADLRSVKRKNIHAAIAISLCLAIVAGTIMLRQADQVELPKLAPPSPVDDNLPRPDAFGKDVEDQTHASLRDFRPENFKELGKNNHSLSFDQATDDQAAIADILMTSPHKVAVGNRKITKPLIDALCKSKKVSILEISNCTGLSNTMLYELSNNLPLTQLSLTSMNLSDESLAMISKFKRLQTIDLAENKTLSGSGLRYLHEHPSITRIFLGNTGITAKNLIAFTKHPPTDLRNLHLNRLNLKDADIAAMDLTSLKTLNLGGNPITNKAMQSIAKLPRLINLHVPNCKLIDDGAIEYLQACNLQTLYLAGTNVSTLKGIGKIKTLNQLGLSGCPKLTDASLVELVGLPLQRLDLRFTPISDGCLNTIAKIEQLSNGSLVVSIDGCENVSERGREILRGIIGKNTTVHQ